MSFSHSTYGPVAIIPASAIRENQNLLRSGGGGGGGGGGRRRAAEDVPINLAYYMSPAATAAQTAAPVMYSSQSYFTTPRAPPSSYYTPRTPPRTPPSARAARSSREYRTRSYTAPSTIFSERITRPPVPLRASYVATTTAPTTGVRYPESMYRRQQRRYSRSRSDAMLSSPSIIFTERDFHNYHIGDVKSFSGPIKYPEPLYKKHRHSRSRSDVIITSGASSIVAATPPQRRRYFYPASYTTYPPSTTVSKRLDGSGYNIFARVALKIAQLVSETF